MICVKIIARFQNSPIAWCQVRRSALDSTSAFARAPGPVGGETIDRAPIVFDQKVLKLNPLFFTYTLSKAALWQATRMLAQGLAPNVRVNAIAPGPTVQSVHQSEAQFAAERAATLTGEGSNPEEIVRALRYLVSASSVTGQMIASDGGHHLMWQTPDTQI